MSASKRAMRSFKRQLDKCGKLVVIEDRDVKIINGLPIEVFSNPRPVKAMVCTTSGAEVFDSTNTKREQTHELCLLYLDGVGSEQWVKLGDKRIKVLSSMNCCEDDQILKLYCTERGDEVRAVNET